ncbi:pyruvate dehydrogenase complex E1 component subunit beta [Cryptosporangium sp. NPDC051539]|uniref:pyruvate dehydrogenase complex E1 component subunit beta n=1 Tax=Cryptosporangium sp. NPDC051539 TaxID=3363962 RepID=UPI003794345B
MNRDELLDAYRRMRLIRRMEERIGTLYAQGLIPGFVHTSVGQEAVAVGTLFRARREDVITSTHRGHGHVLAKGLDPARMFAELMGKETGANRGRGGSMHVADPALGIFGANGIVGAGLPIATGAAHALRQRGDGTIAIAFFGDGAVATGAFHESLNLAALWRLPVVFVCENNGYSEFSRTDDQHPVPIAARAGAYGMPFRRVDGNDVEAVEATMSDVFDQLRSGGGPQLVEAVTLRVRGHYEGDPQKYRAGEQDASDPLVVTRQRLAALGAADLDEVDDDVERTVAAAEKFATDSPEPDPASARDYVIVAHRTFDERPAGSIGDRDVSTSRVLRQALDDALADDPAVFLAGIDVAGGNVFGLTRGLAGKWPGRVLDTPIAETAIMGLGVGAAMAGLRPVVELMYLDFLGVCLDQLMNQAAKLPFMTGGAVTVPMVVRTQFGSGRSSGSQHSQSLETLLAHLPGMTVVMPSSPDDAYGLLRTAIEDDNPVVFIENRLLYERKGPMPSPEHRVPLGRARIVRPGEHLTIVSWSRMAQLASAAAEQLATEGIDAEVIDLRTIVPLDRETVLASLAKTNRLLIVHEAVAEFGVGAELAALAVDEGFWSLDAPVVRVGAPSTPAPYAPSLERTWIPTEHDIIRAARSLAADR